MITINDETEATTSDTAKLNEIVLAGGGLAMAKFRKPDVVCIETKSSTYKFTLLDPVTRRGFLRGGALGTRTMSVKLSGMVFKNTPEGQCEDVALCCGGRAMFHLISGNFQENYLLTSTILGLSYKHNES